MIFPLLWAVIRGAIMVKKPASYKCMYEQFKVIVKGV